MYIIGGRVQETILTESDESHLQFSLQLTWLTQPLEPLCARWLCPLSSYALTTAKQTAFSNLLNLMCLQLVD